MCSAIRAKVAKISTGAGRVWSRRRRAAHQLLFCRAFGRLRASGTSKVPRRGSGGFEGTSRILGCHGNGRFDIRQATPSRRGQYGRGCRFVVREFAYHQPVMRSEGQVPTDEPTSDALEEIGDGFLAIASVWPRRPRFRPAF
jgi:hypothetical protein